MRNVSIDLLKSIAIIAVILYHFYPNFYHSGFLGVEIFIFVTGFLSSKSLKKIGTKDFILNRFMRIFTALNVQIFLFLLILWFIGVQIELYSNLKLSMFSNVFLANIYLYWSSGDYFSQKGNLFFLHNWSIGIEFQIWVSLAVLKLISGKKNALLIFILGIFGILFSSYLVFSGNYLSEYFNPFRLFGLAFIGYRLGTLKYSMDLQVNPFLVLSGLLFIFYILTFDFRLIVYIIICLFTICLLVVRIFTIWSLSAIFKWLSDHTFGLYLYHYPFLVLFRDYYNIKLFELSTLILTVCFAILSRKYFENV